jgi:hypothetical protein
MQVECLMSSIFLRYAVPQNLWKSIVLVFCQTLGMEI